MASHAFAAPVEYSHEAKTIDIRGHALCPVVEQVLKDVIQNMV